MGDSDATRDRVVAITGAGTGIGQAMAVKFGALRQGVVVGGRRVEKLTETAQLVEKAGGTCSRTSSTSPTVSRWSVS